MTVDFRLPHLGDGINSADVVKVLVKEGDPIKIDQVVVEIETDKATVEVPSDVAGTIKKVFVKEGQKANVGEPLVAIEVSGQQLASPSTSRSGSAVGNAKEKEPEIRNQKSEETSSKPITNHQSQNTNNQSQITNHQSPITKNYEFKIPALGENITTANVSKVLVKPGDKVTVDQIVLEIETDKATVEVPTEVGGVVKSVKIKEGEKAAIGQVVLVIETPETRTVKSEPVKSEMPTQPKVASSKTEATRQTGPSEIDLTHHMPKAVIVPKDISKVVVPAAPSVRGFAREIGVDIHQVRGTGPHGRISFDDVKVYAKNLNQQIQSGALVSGSFGVTKETLPDFSKWGEIDRQPMSNIRRKTAEHLAYSWATIPHVTQFDKADITELENLRKQFGKKVEDAGGKLTITAVLLKVIASALKVFPQFSSSVDMEKSEIVYKKYYNIGVAVDTDRGLLVPVIRDVDKKNIIQISIELAEASKKARDKKLSLEEMQGGCFTISNLGGIGGTYFTPIVNSPEVAILGVSKSSYEPVYIDSKPALSADRLEPRLMMPLSLSYDHRIIDGADGIRFLRWVVNALENPFLLSLEG
ncbi:MAG: dihydrolipoyllysine-residue acetyltransferase [Bacteroidetes bacterium]|nr:dihydrolipoyllysine-residue acetyltransferase [Bacteroidota bacterium]